jgi:hypothetical protein
MKGEMMMTMITWERMFIRTGFDVEKMGENTFSFAHENDENIVYFQKILHQLETESSFNGYTFMRKEHVVNEDEFLNACEIIEKDDQTFFLGVANVDLNSLDTCIAGLIRWLNWIGFHTTICCDGHDRKPVYIEFKNRELETRLVNHCLDLLTNKKWVCSPRGNLDIRRTRENRGYQRLNRYRLLDLAEIIYENRKALKDFVQAGLVLSGVNKTNIHYKITQRAAVAGERIQLKTQKNPNLGIYTFLHVKKVHHDHCLAEDENGEFYSLAKDDYYVVEE